MACSPLADDLLANGDRRAFRKIGGGDLGVGSVGQASRHLHRAYATAVGDPQRALAGRRAVWFWFAAICLPVAILSCMSRRQTRCDQALGRWLPAQGSVGHVKHILVAGDFELQIGRQIRKESAVRIVGVHDDGVRDHVLIHARIESRLIGSNDATKRLIRIGVDRRTARTGPNGCGRCPPH